LMAMFSRPSPEEVQAKAKNSLKADAPVRSGKRSANRVKKAPVFQPEEEDDLTEETSGTVQRVKSRDGTVNDEPDFYDEPNWAEKLQKGDPKSLYAAAKLPSGVQKPAKVRTTIAEFKMMYRENAAAVSAAKAKSPSSNS